MQRADQHAPAQAGDARPKTHGALCEMTLAFTARPTIPCTGAPSAGAYFIARSPENLVLVAVPEHVVVSLRLCCDDM